MEHRDDPPVVYIVGKMRGVSQHNFPAFDTAAKRWAEAGWCVISPADIDREKGIDADKSPTLEQMRDISAEDLSHVSQADAIALIREDWTTSTLGRVEILLAVALDIPVYWANDAWGPNSALRVPPEYLYRKIGEALCRESV